MKNFPYKENHAPVCLIFRKCFDRFAIPQIAINKPGKRQKLFSFASTLSYMSLVFFFSRHHSLYQNKIKSPE